MLSVESSRHPAVAFERHAGRRQAPGRRPAPQLLLTRPLRPSGRRRAPQQPRVEDLFAWFAKRVRRSEDRVPFEPEVVVEEVIDRVARGQRRDRRVDECKEHIGARREGDRYRRQLVEQRFRREPRELRLLEHHVGRYQSRQRLHDLLYQLRVDRCRLAGPAMSPDLAANRRRSVPVAGRTRPSAESCLWDPLRSQTDPAP